MQQFKLLACVFTSGVILALAGCNSAGPQTAAAPAPQVGAPASPQIRAVTSGMPIVDQSSISGNDCKANIARWQNIQENDHRNGMVGDSVYAQIQGEIAQANSVCQAGRDAEASAMVTASRRKHGYPS